MVEPPRILIAGGAGVFGRLLAHELLETTQANLVLAGRDLDRVGAACQSLRADDRVTPLQLDLSDLGAVARAASSCYAVACTAGPFQALPRELPTTVVGVGAHWLDIADDPAWLLPLLRASRSKPSSAGDGSSPPHAAGLAVIPGLSSTPALSGALVRWCRQRLPGADAARVTLVIGNRNVKGSGAIASALGAHLSDPRPLRLLVGRYVTLRFTSADADLMADGAGFRVEFRVAFEWNSANYLMGAIAPFARRLSPSGRVRLARGLATLAAPAGRFGSDVGCLQADVWDQFGSSVSAAFVGAGQRLAILPCALALESLLSGELMQRGVVHPADWLVPAAWIQRLEARGIRFISKEFPASSVR